MSWHAECPCGWKGKQRVNPNDCVTDGENHQYKWHPYQERFSYDVRRNFSPTWVARRPS